MLYNPKLIEYVQSLHIEDEQYIKQQAELALAADIPIIVPDTARFLEMLCIIKKPLKILEIGTATGYSALWLLKSSQAYLHTIEIDSNRVKKARNVLSDAGYQARVTVHHADAVQLLQEWVNERDSSHKHFDVIFIDAAKGQYKKFFDLASELANEHAVVVTDNVFLHGFVPGLVEPERRQESMVNKLRIYNDYLHEHQEWQTVFLTIGDGLAVSVRK